MFQCIFGHFFLKSATITKQARNKLALPNALNLRFGEGLLTCAFLSWTLNGHLLEPFGALDGDALRLVSPFTVSKINMRLNGFVLEHSNRLFLIFLGTSHFLGKVPKKP
jgi:hypothetical protein